MHLQMQECTLQYITDGKRHLICYPYSIENLHKMAEELNIKRCWFHKDHYDIPKRRIKEIESKCVLVTPKQLLLFIYGVVELNDLPSV